LGSINFNGWCKTDAYPFETDAYSFLRKSLFFFNEALFRVKQLFLKLITQCDTAARLGDNVKKASL
jgi:hypothetical protein